ncbi:MAG: M23 family metallopeptidase, partial [Bacteroidaceae bacterium]|nr:M23 family metallopeptidase [Bacteroidaceae bacterium]
MRILFLALFSLLFSSFPLVAQEGLLRVPFDFPLFLSGNFGELRSNHFHGGIDFKTQGVEGKEIHSPADGYISRISVSPGGYGNAIYIVHDCGYTTVHGHLQRFLPKVEAIVRQHQYAHESFVVDTILPAYALPIKQGSVVGWAGNSGYSFGPHLHMEVRTTDTNEPVDPLMFYKSALKDTRAPRAHRIMLYPQKGRGVVNESSQKCSFSFGNGNRVQQVITAWGLIGVGLSANDYMDGTQNTYGVRSVRLLVDGVEFFHSLVDRFSFDENRLINSWTDYPEYQARRRWYMKSFIAPGNPLRMLKSADINRGLVDICEERPYHFAYHLADIH